MHPDGAFRQDAASAEGRALMEALIDEVGFGMVFATTPDGPRVAHTPLLSTGDGAVQFHLSRGNALTRHLDGATALAVVNGPDGYVSPRWYADAGTAPTWNYVAVELEGRVRRMEPEGTLAMLETLGQRHEACLPGDGWAMDAVPEAKLRGLLAGIVGFELEILAWRPTFKLSQNKSAEDRANVADALEAHGSPALAHLMRTLAA